MKELLSYHVQEGHYGVELYKTDNGYQVVYGSDERNYANSYEAAHAYGDCIVHTLTCAGKLD